jgi:hypothetical protein
MNIQEKLLDISILLISLILIIEDQIINLLYNHEIKNQETFSFTLLPGIIAFAFLSCEKESDLAKEVSGTYSGTVTIVGTGSAPATSKLTRSSDERVNLVVTIYANNIPLNGIKVSTSGNNYVLSYTDSSGSLSGTVTGNRLDWTMTAGGMTETFTGTR